MQKKNPILAAVLSFFFGPLGYLYIGWRYAVSALAVFGVFVLAITVISFPIPTFMKYVILAVFAWKGFAIASIRNKLIDAENEDAVALNTFPIAAMAMTDLLVGIAMAYAAAIGIYVAVKLALGGHILRGIFDLLVGTPVLVGVANFVFEFIATGIDAIFVARAKNIFRT